LVVHPSAPLLLFIVEGSDSEYFRLAVSCSEFQQLLPVFTHTCIALRTTQPKFLRLHANGGFTRRSPHRGRLNVVSWSFSDPCLCCCERQRSSGDEDARLPAGAELGEPAPALASALLQPSKPPPVPLRTPFPHHVVLS